MYKTKYVWVCMTPGVYTKVLEAAECCGDTKSPVPFTGYRYGFLSFFTEIVSSNGRFSLASESFFIIGIGISTSS